MEYYEVRRQVALLLSLICGEVREATFFVQWKFGRRDTLYNRQIEYSPPRTIAWELMRIFNKREYSLYKRPLWMGLQFSTTEGETHEMICNLYGDVILRPDIQAEGGK